MTDAASMPTSAPARAAAILRDDDAYTDSLIDFVTASPSSYHAAAEVARRLEEAGFTRADETITWEESLPRRGYVIRDGAIAAWALPETLAPGVGLRIVGAHTDSPALKLKPAAALVRSGWQLINAEVYGGPLLASFLDRELGLAGRLTTRDGAVVTTQTTTVQNVLDNLMPGLPALGMTFLCMYLLRKGVNALWLIFGIFGIGILGYWLKILA